MAKKFGPKKVRFTFLTSPIYLAPLAKIFDLVVVVFVVVGGGGGGGNQVQNMTIHYPI